MTRDEPIRRDVLQALAVVPFMALIAQTGEARAQVGTSPVSYTHLTLPTILRV